MKHIMTKRRLHAYARLETGPIDEIYAAVFTGDVFLNQSNREDFIRMMERWERQIKSYEDIEEID